MRSRSCCCSDADEPHGQQFWKKCRSRHFTENMRMRPLFQCAQVSHEEPLLLPSRVGGGALPLHIAPLEAAAEGPAELMRLLERHRCVLPFKACIGQELMSMRSSFQGGHEQEEQRYDSELVCWRLRWRARAPAAA